MINLGSSQRFQIEDFFDVHVERLLTNRAAEVMGLSSEIGGPYFCRDIDLHAANGINDFYHFHELLSMLSAKRGRFIGHALPKTLMQPMQGDQSADEGEGSRDCLSAVSLLSDDGRHGVPIQGKRK